MKHIVSVAALAVGGLLASAATLLPVAQPQARDAQGGGELKVLRDLSCPVPPRAAGQVTLTSVGEKQAELAGRSISEPTTLRGTDQQPAGAVSAAAGPLRWYASCQAAAQRQLVLLPTSQGATLLLTNPTSTDARVDVHLFDEDGPVQAVGTAGITVPAQGSRSVPVSVQVAAGQSFAAEVVASEGRVAAWGTTSGADGADFSPATSAQTSGVVAALPTARRTLLLASNPGAERATAQLVLATADGPIVPSGVEELVLEPGTSQLLDITTPLAGEQAALRWTSDHPVALAAVAQQGKDLGVSAGSTPQTEGQLLGTGGGRLLLSNPSEQDLEVELSGAVTRRVNLKAGASAGVEMPKDPGLVQFSAPQPVSAGLLWTNGGVAIGGVQPAGTVRATVGLSADPRLR